MTHYHFKRRTWQQKKLFEEGWRSDPATMIAAIIGIAGIGMSVASMSGGKAKTPTLLATPTPPSTSAAEQQSLADQQRRAKGGRMSTILTGPQGTLGQTPTVKKTLLGA